MPEDIEKLDEGMNFKDAVDDLKKDMDEQTAGLPEDIVNQMRIGTLVRSMFRFPLGTRVRNRHGEEGYIELCGINFTGEIYMVNMPNNERIWYVPEEIKMVPLSKFDDFNDDPIDDSDDPDTPTKPLIKTDFPDAIKKDIPDIAAETDQLKKDINKLPPADPDLSDKY